jgi:hypothetical protein
LDDEWTSCKQQHGHSQKTMKTCSGCSADNPDNSRFCAGCGSSLISPMESFLGKHDLLKLLGPIEENDFHDPKDLLTLSDSDLTELGVSLGDRVRFKKALEILKDEMEAESDSDDFDEEDTDSDEDDEEDEEDECTGFTLSTESGLTHFDPTSGTIRELIDDDEERGDFMILTDSNDDQKYIQVRYAKSDENGDWFDIEFRDGSPDRHYESSHYVSRDMVSSILINYGIEDPSWRRELKWKKMELDGSCQETLQQEGVSPILKAQELINNLPEQDRVYIAPNIPQAKLTAAFNSYIKKPGTHCLVLYDVTVFGGAKEGFVIAEDGLYLKETFESAKKWYWSEISNVSSDDTNLFVNTKKVMNCTSGSIKSDFLEKLVKIIKTLSKLSN